MTDDELREYVAQHREDIYYALQEGDRWARTVAISALIAAGDAEVELAKRELEAAQETESE
ncbi:hypothetical protein SAMN04488694_10853 [Natrinema hispanicum]|uniref:Uncharacterized protein n=2 Tax=Natrinema hispanicum TaxID=392421 RepID=A0A1I0F9Y6_9EURY|nr:hypothetical protein [Natrinema hispanicum]SET54836.1 hypothetical protein SAMN04488694_10853 [Natrinema hispanicum]